MKNIFILPILAMMLTVGSHDRTSSMVILCIFSLPLFLAFFFGFLKAAKVIKQNPFSKITSYFDSTEIKTEINSEVEEAYLQVTNVKKFYLGSLSKTIGIVLLVSSVIIYLSGNAFKDVFNFDAEKFIFPFWFLWAIYALLDSYEHRYNIANKEFRE